MLLFIGTDRNCILKTYSKPFSGLIAILVLISSFQNGQFSDASVAVLLIDMMKLFYGCLKQYLKNEKRFFK